MCILGSVAFLEMVMSENRLEHLFHSHLLCMVPPSPELLDLISSLVPALEAGAVALSELCSLELLFAFVALAREALAHHWPSNIRPEFPICYCEVISSRRRR